MVYAIVGKWRSKCRSGHALNRRLLKRANKQHSSTCVNRAKVSPMAVEVPPRMLVTMQIVDEDVE